MATRTSNPRRRSPVSRALIRKIVREELMIEPEMILLSAAMVLCGEKSIKSTLTLLDAMGVTVRAAGERRHYVLVSELRAGMQRLPVKRPKYASRTPKGTEGEEL